MERSAGFILLYAPSLVYARGGHCYTSGCYRTKEHFFWFALVVGGGYAAIKLVALVSGWALNTIEKQRRNPGWVADFFVACKRLFTNL